MTLQVSKAITFAFDDEHWRNKLGTLLLLSLVPGVNLIVWMGYSISIAHHIVRGASLPLPNWTDWADILARGLMACTASLLYFAPVLVIVGAGMILNHLAPGMGALWMCITPLVFVYTAGALLLITVGHVRYARSDQYSDYFAPLKRIGELRRNFRDYLIGSLIQFGIFLVILIGVMLLSITLIGPFALLMGGFLIQGYILGQLARQARRR